MELPKSWWVKYVRFFPDGLTDVISDFALENYPDGPWIRRIYPQDFAVRLLCDRLQMDGVAIGPGAWMTPMVRDLLGQYDTIYQLYYI